MVPTETDRRALEGGEEFGQEQTIEDAADFDFAGILVEELLGVRLAVGGGDDLPDTGLRVGGKPKESIVNGFEKVQEEVHFIEDIQGVSTTEIDDGLFYPVGGRGILHDLAFGCLGISSEQCEEFFGHVQLLRSPTGE